MLASHMTLTFSKQTLGTWFQKRTPKFWDTLVCKDKHKSRDKFKSNGRWCFLPKEASNNLVKVILAKFFWWIQSHYQVIFWSKLNCIICFDIKNVRLGMETWLSASEHIQLLPRTQSSLVPSIHTGQFTTTRNLLLGSCPLLGSLAFVPTCTFHTQAHIYAKF